MKLLKMNMLLSEDISIILVWGGSSSRAGDTVAVHHGADDNASGVGEMIELAEKFALTKGSHKRSIDICSFFRRGNGIAGFKILH